MKSGFVILAGRSNVGKSTLLNALVGSKVAIVTPKPQTTRQPMRGILHDERGQIVFVDTPGVFLGRKDIISKKLNAIVEQSLKGVDAVVYVMDPTRAPGPEEEKISKLLRAAKVPIINILNKSDLPMDERPFRENYLETDVGQKETLELSAKSHNNLNLLVDSLFDLMPDGDEYYPPLQITDLRQQEWLEEIIREKVFLSLEQELPYSVKVSVEEVEERKGGLRYIAATIWTTEERYKGMIIGAKGAKIKEIGSKVRKELEETLQSKVFIDLNVKVDPKWPIRFSKGDIGL
ncbi:MAG: GTPase Era [Patescibacteria group bacterium]|nr:GTPase Era [Patescibacteria group bacterium]MBU2509498.1 GTPase Era [Patescibacteria group bacterium]